jgi:myo-inositol 2-dehydrogenase / D-chiro-inositol 1-dehydrogenase
LIGTQAGIDFNSGTFSYRKELNKTDRKVTGTFDYNMATQEALGSFLSSVRERTEPVATVDHGRDAVLTCLLVRKAVYERRAVEMKEVLAEV